MSFVKPRVSILVFFLCAVILAVAWIGGSSSTPQLDYDFAEPITHPEMIGLGNLTVVEIDPNGRSPSMHWQAFNKRRGNAFNVPYEVITIESGAERYVITDRTVGNGALSVNGEVKKFEADSKRLSVKLGEGVSIVEGADYRSARKCYDPPAAKPPK